MANNQLWRIIGHKGGWGECSRNLEKVADVHEKNYNLRKRREKRENEVSY